MQLGKALDGTDAVAQEFVAGTLAGPGYTALRGAEVSSEAEEKAGNPRSAL